jgi:hypothetical protein
LPRSRAPGAEPAHRTCSVRPRPTFDNTATPFQADRHRPPVGSRALREIVAQQRQERLVAQLRLLQTHHAGRRSSSHGKSRGTRIFTELTFQVAIRIRPYVSA